MQRNEPTRRLAELYARLEEVERAIRAPERVREIRERRGATAAEICAGLAA